MSKPMPADPAKLAAVSASAAKPTATGVVITTDAGSLAIEAFASGIVRLRLGDAKVNDYGLVQAKSEALPLTLVETDTSFRVRAAAIDLDLDIGKDPLTVTLKSGGRTVLGPSGDSHFVRRFKLPPFARTKEGWFFSFGVAIGEPVYGGGEKYSSLDRRGQLLDNWNEDALGVNSELCYKNCPFLWSPEGWGVFVNTPARVVHGVAYPQWSNQAYGASVEDEVLDLFLIAAETPAAILERYTHLTGRAPKVPTWSLGNWISKAYYRTPEEALAVAAKLVERKIPCDVLTMDGRAWQDTDTRFLFQWDPKRFSDPAAFCAEIKTLVPKLCVWEYPMLSERNPRHKELAEKGYLLKDQLGGVYHYEWDLSPFGKVLTPLPHSGAIDFTNPEAYAWWRDQHAALFAMGVDTIKSDFGEQIMDDMVAFNGDSGARLHNVYPLLYNRCVYEAARKAYGDQALVWGRSGWAGSQTVPIQWAGDSQSSWGGLAASIVGGLSWGLSGVPYYSTDIGGFYGEQPDETLYIRWAQAGVLGSHCRFHGIGDREPWHFGARAETIVRDWLQLRYRLLPYLEDTSAEAAATGLPMMRAMVLAFADQPLARPFETQYMLGDNLLVVPVLSADSRARYYIPAGDWYDFWTGAKVEGNRVVDEIVPLERLPLLVRAGTVLKLGPAVQHTGLLDPNHRVETVRVYGAPRADGAAWTDSIRFVGGDVTVADPSITVERFA